MSLNLPVPRYTLWQAVSASLTAALRALEEVRALARLPGPQGEPGEKGERGNDGFGFDQLDQFEDARSFGLTFRRGDQVKEFRWSKTTLADGERGVWKDGAYSRGDVVSHGGSMFIAQCDTSNKPEQSPDWRLAVKRGRDGKDGKPGKDGERGLQGSPGKDLTQLGPDGTKW